MDMGKKYALLMVRFCIGLLQIFSSRSDLLAITEETLELDMWHTAQRQIKVMSGYYE